MKSRLRLSVFIPAFGIVLLAGAVGLVNNQWLISFFQGIFEGAYSGFGWLYQLITIALFILCLIMTFSKIGNVRIGGKDYPCSLSPLFTSETKEFVSAYQLLMNYKIPNESSLYASLISKAVAMGLEEKKVRQQLEYTIMTDFILSNTDRHLNNMGFLWETEQHRFTDMAPIFDTGNRLFIGEVPQLIVDLETQENYIKTGDRLIEYHRKVGLSPDLLAGKRANVLETALEAYYLQACHVAEEYRKKRS